MNENVSWLKCRWIINYKVNKHKDTTNVQTRAHFVTYIKIYNHKYRVEKRANKNKKSFTQYWPIKHGWNTRTAFSRVNTFSKAQKILDPFLYRVPNENLVERMTNQPTKKKKTWVKTWLETILQWDHIIRNAHQHVVAILTNDYTSDTSFMTVCYIAAMLSGSQNLFTEGQTHILTLVKALKTCVC